MKATWSRPSRRRGRLPTKAWRGTQRDLEGRAEGPFSDSCTDILRPRGPTLQGFVHAHSKGARTGPSTNRGRAPQGVAHESPKARATDTALDKPCTNGATIRGRPVARGVQAQSRTLEVEGPLGGPWAVRGTVRAAFVPRLVHEPPTFVRDIRAQKDCRRESNQGPPAPEAGAAPAPLKWLLNAIITPSRHRRATKRGGAVRATKAPRGPWRVRGRLVRTNGQRPGHGHPASLRGAATSGDLRAAEAAPAPTKVPGAARFVHGSCHEPCTVRGTSRARTVRHREPWSGPELPPPL